MIKKLLVANRGEIACRVFRTCRLMGIRTVAIYSDADRGALHTTLADEAISIGGEAASESYLLMDKVLEAARSTGADAIHPGYGFLSERAEFSEACAAAGITFLGPSPQAMRALGGKIEAKRMAVAAGVPLTPGYFEQGATDEELLAGANKIGYPVMLKASAGGGGRGMRVVHSSEAFSASLALARDEAVRGFGDGEMLVEKLIARPRHIEVQVIADSHGNVAPLYERECSLQRRNQKLVEEAPSPYFGPEHRMWAPMRDAAVALVQKSGYTGAGTVEFMVDEEAGEFYFLEVNARLQVEHPITEAITGLDLVRLQIEVAQGASLADLVPEFLAGDRALVRGHALEIRLVAENPAANFLPSTGTLIAWAPPTDPTVRVDTGFASGDTISRHYDSMLAKVIVHGADRSEAIAKMRDALLDFHVVGVHVNLGYLLDVLAHPDFRAGRFDTGWLGREFGNWQPTKELPAGLAEIVGSASAGQVSSARNGRVSNPAWDLEDGFRVGGSIG